MVRGKASTPINTAIMFVPQQEAWIVERMGKFHRILEPGLNILVPLLDKVKYVQSLKEIAIDVPQQSAISLDNVTLNIDGVLYLRVIDPYKASYGVEDPEFAITQLAQTTMRSELGKISLDTVFKERESLNVSIVESLNKASEAWGITCLRYEIRDIKLPLRVQEAMQMQVEAERKKRAAILESEGVRAADINVAEGKRTSRILASGLFCFSLLSVVLIHQCHLVSTLLGIVKTDPGASARNRMNSWSPILMCSVPHLIFHVKSLPLQFCYHHWKEETSRSNGQLAICEKLL
ncbi:hypothetical protein J437_LFUL000934 [Ladona fulva]|uniref:Band 7 domain-containing protein n=1 Tax=Ladona fulva TaxID=123851 RepID=A0A8K0P1U3_LADFU|nr:hypothetical protein J437_LFUL000934 [Ladona fulva]